MTLRPLPAFVLALALPGAPLFAATPAAPPPWLGAPLTADPQAVLAALADPRLAPSEDETKEGVQYLLQEERYTFDAEGRRTLVSHRALRALRADVLPHLGSVEADWKPWKDQPPVLRARVIQRNGTAHLLDQSAIADRPASSDRDVFDDRRIRSAPLPGLEEGAFVEWETVEKETSPFPGGALGRFAAGFGTRVQMLRLVVTTPPGLPFWWKAPGLDLQPTVTNESGNLVRTWEIADQKAFPAFEPQVPIDVRQRPVIELATGKSWADVASIYTDVIEGKLAGQDLGKLAATAVRNAKGRAEEISALLALVQRDVRYTGLAFGEGAIVPSPPLTVAKRKFGDCKDQATLLVGLLRARRIDASVVLLRAGEPLDLDPALPALATFNHAIVHVPGEPALFIDPTSVFHRAGELPEADQGRWALLARKDTTNLVQIPVATAKENRERVVIEVRLAEDGPGSFVETGEYAGTFEASYRGLYDGDDPTETKKGFTSYVERNFGNAKLERYELGAPRDLSKPFRLRVEGTKASIAYTDETEAGFFYRRAAVLSNLPRTSTEKRAFDLSLVPFHHEVEYRVVPPPGFVPHDVPESSTEDVGPASLATTSATNPDGSVSLLLSLTLDRRRLTPDEVVAIAKAVEDLRKEKPLRLVFEHRAEAALQNGKVKEAITILRDLAKASPKAADPHRRLSRVLLGIGLGEAARREATLATRLEPSAPKVWHQLAVTLTHDLFGRPRRKGWDPDAVEASLRKGLELDPENLPLQLELAIALEFDRDGRRYRDVGRLEDAIGRYKTVLGKRPDLLDIARNYLIALLQVGRPADVLAFLKERQDAETFAVHQIAAVAMISGAEKARGEARRLLSDAAKRRGALEGAAATLFLLRRYEPASALFAEAAKGGPKAAELGAKADFCARITPWKRAEVVPGDPVSVVRTFTTSLFDETANRAKLVELLVKAVRPRVEADLSRGLSESLLRQERSEGMPVELAKDLISSKPEYSVEGDAKTGWKVKTTTPTFGRGANESLTWLAEEDGAIRIVASNSDRGDLLRYAQDLARRGDLDGARLWIGKAAEGQTTASTDEHPLYGPLFPRFWRVSREAPKTPDEVLLACAAGLVDLGLDDQAFALVETFAKKAPEDRNLAALRFRALVARDDQAEAKAAEALQKSRATRRRRRPNLDTIRAMLAVIAPLQAKEPDTEDWDQAAIGLLARLGRLDEAKGLAEAHLARKPSHLGVKRALSQVLMEQGKVDEAVAVTDEILRAPAATFDDYNNSAWFRLVAGKIDEKALAQASQSVEASSRRNLAILNTQAALYAELGRTDEAWAIVLEGMELRGADEPDAPDWYVMGRILEEYGLPEDALAAYAKAQDPTEESRSAGTITNLALKKIAKLGAKKI